MDVNDILANMPDNGSRLILKNRMLYSQTSDNKYVVEIKKAMLNDKVTPLLVDQTKDMVIYGTDSAGKLFASLLFDKSRIAAFCNGNENWINMRYMGYKVITLNALVQNHINDYIVITSTDNDAVKSILHRLHDLGFADDQIISLSGIGLNALDEIQYFDQSILNLGDNEIFVDAGCFDCKTTRRFMRNRKGKYKKIIAFEPYPPSFDNCLSTSKTIDNMEVYPYAIWDDDTILYIEAGVTPCTARVQQEPLHTTDVVDITNDNADDGTYIRHLQPFKVDAVKLDSILNGERVTFIKMDIEGSELNALKGAELTLLKYKPKLAICVYHNPDDIWKIPRYLLSLHTDYKLYLRHYSIDSDRETVLYAV